MIEFKSYSQAGQDEFAFYRSGRGTHGTFLDIGCGHPTSYSNSYGLEKLGWRGMCVDIHEEPNFKTERPEATLVIGDATALHWPILLASRFGNRCDYLSLDVDECSFDVLARLPLHEVRFGIITIEHDKYRLGPDQQRRQRELLSAYEYVLSKPDVLWEGKPFEDWYVHRSALCSCQS